MTALMCQSYYTKPITKRNRPSFWLPSERNLARQKEYVHCPTTLRTKFLFIYLFIHRSNHRIIQYLEIFICFGASGTDLLLQDFQNSRGQPDINFSSCKFFPLLLGSIVKDKSSFPEFRARQLKCFLLYRF